MKIAPYLATSVQRSYLRQQRIGERIAELKGADESAATQPAAQVDIPEALLATSRTGRKDLKRAREEQIDQLTGRFVERFLETFGRPAGEGPQAAAEGGEEAPGRPSFGRILDNLGIAVYEDTEVQGGLIVQRQSGQVLLNLPPEAREVATEELKKLARDILEELI
ncbi:MAG: hypothetical protein A3J27_02990 [Candidatus Tectomicrobia bacterium RIFCSPLOWO2_12_FULL_69_37]|nr:MAG: hypothetical protein A3J27_02990 [Candidatus Tectomicrobia bacterium RIFCSPLOWO2_12_FULL_69_37]OGL64205.1 MAG: hypothetical protein A3I72_11715 [Candidatus Tectomicrobia bacterium RIFCSPLOWO2_02_FULL_70_19]